MLSIGTTAYVSPSNGDVLGGDGSESSPLNGLESYFFTNLPQQSSISSLVLLPGAYYFGVDPFVIDKTLSIQSQQGQSSVIFRCVNPLNCSFFRILSSSAIGSVLANLTFEDVRNRDLVVSLSDYPLDGLSAPCRSGYNRIPIVVEQFGSVSFTGLLFRNCTGLSMINVRGFSSTAEYAALSQLIEVSGNITVSSCSFIDVSTAYGVISVLEKHYNLVVEKSEFIGIRIDGLQLRSCAGSFVPITGAILFQSEILIVDSSLFENIHAEGSYSSAISGQATDSTIKNCIFRNILMTTAVPSITGGTIRLEPQPLVNFFDSPSARVQGCIFYNCSLIPRGPALDSRLDGGAIYSRNINLTISNSTFSNGVAPVGAALGAAST